MEHIFKFILISDSYSLADKDKHWVKYSEGSPEFSSHQNDDLA